MQRVLVVREHAAPWGPLDAWRGWLPALAEHPAIELWLAAPLRPPGLSELRFVHLPFVVDQYQAMEEAQDVEQMLAGLIAPEPETLQAHWRIWRDLFALVRPDCVLAGVTPLARLAAHFHGLPVIDIGPAWSLPPADAVGNRQAEHSARDGALRIADVEAVGHRVQQLMTAQSLPSLDDLSVLWAGHNGGFLFGWPMLDPYAGRGEADWVGWPVQQQAPVVRGDFVGRRVMASLHRDQPELQACLAMLSAPDWLSWIHLDGFGVDERWGESMDEENTIWLAAEQRPPDLQTLDVLLGQNEDELLAAIACGCPLLQLAGSPRSTQLVALASTAGEPVATLARNPVADDVRCQLTKLASGPRGAGRFSLTAAGLADRLARTISDC